jgi:uncharacterized membrane protein YkvA (DUF1232 family)
MSVIDALVGVAVALVVLWLLLLVALLVVRPKGRYLQEAVRILPDLLRLLRRLAREPSVPRGVRIRMWLLLTYLALPVDLVPDFIPVLGYADDAIIVVAVLRSVVRRVGYASVKRHWPGTEDGWSALARLTGISPAHE